MDRERLGRVLGRGARMAARTAMEAVDAATATAPAAHNATPRSRPQPVAEVIPPAARASASARTVSQQDVARAASAAHQGIAAARQGVAAARQGVAAPLKRASKALWYEFTGCFFALFALSFSAAVWNTRANAWSPVPNVRYRLYSFCALAAIFLYFSVSSFVRARRVR